MMILKATSVLGGLMEDMSLPFSITPVRNRIFNVCKAQASTSPLNPNVIRKVRHNIESKCSMQHFNQVSPQYHTKI